MISFLSFRNISRVHNEKKPTKLNVYVQIRHFYYYCCCCCRRTSGTGVNSVYPEHVNAASLPQQCCQTVTSPRNRTAAGVSDGRQWTFCFVRFILHFRTFPDLSTPPSRPSAGIRQRWNGCLKRTTLSVTGFRVLRNQTFLPCHASSFFCFGRFASSLPFASPQNHKRACLFLQRDDKRGKSMTLQK